MNATAGSGLCDKSVTQESGYYDLKGDDAGKHYFYWMFNSRSAPSTDPLILWMTGGPGCSSMLALLAENGPCKVNADGKTTASNPYSWNTKSNLIYVDQPANVGFSWGDKTDTDEAEVAEDMYAFLQALMAAHPELQKTPLYIVGESYGGHFAPATAARVVAGNKAGAAGTVHINLAGLAVGNGLTDPSIQYSYYAELAYNYSMTKVGAPRVTLEQYSMMKMEIPACISGIEQCQTDTNACPNAQGSCDNAQMAPYQENGWNPYDIRKKCGSNPLCYDFTALTNWLNDASVQSALGVKAGTTWQSCNYQVNQGFAYDWMKDFQQDANAVLEAGLPVLIYAGDCDFVCNWLGNQAWTLALDWSGKSDFNKAAMHPWSAGGTAAGEARTAPGSTKGSRLTFLRVYDAGHMVPMDQPANALAMINNFISGGPF